MGMGNVVAMENGTVEAMVVIEDDTIIVKAVVVIVSARGSCNGSWAGGCG